MSKVQIYTAVGRIPDISEFKCKDSFLNGEYIGTYQPELWHGKKKRNKNIKRLFF